jgi:hypothetical protein
LTIKGFNVGQAALSDLRIASSSSPPISGSPGTGGFVTELDGLGGDFTKATSFLKRYTSSPHTTGPGGSFGMSLGLDGGCFAINVYATSTGATSLVIDAAGK